MPVLFDLFYRDIYLLTFFIDGNKAFINKGDLSNQIYFPKWLNILNPQHFFIWLSNRNLLVDRVNAKALFRLSKSKDFDLAQLLLKTKGLSLTDVYWVLPHHRNKEYFYSDYSLYTGNFDNSAQQAAWEGKIEGSVRLDRSPEYTTGGSLVKVWRVVNNKRLLYKGNTIYNSGDFQYEAYEAISEFYAPRIAKLFNLPVIEYRLGHFKKRECSICELFTSEENSYLPFFNIALDLKVSYKDVYFWITENYSQYLEWFCDLMIFDSVTLNLDRHTQNFGFLTNNNNNSIISVAPVFDNGDAFLSHTYTTSVDDIASLVRAEDNLIGALGNLDEIARVCYRPRHKSILYKLRDFHIPSNKEVRDERYKIVEKVIQSRADYLIKGLKI